jgi:CDP-6-deoxy-D-xylo-4-hexulose-3-dehydrase
MKKIELVQDTIDKDDINQLILWLKSYPKLTKGPLTLEFESKWSEWIGSKYSVFVNSGSSANLLMIYVLKLLKLLKNNKVCVPSLSWVTDLSPVIQLGLHPILIDCNLENLSVDLNHLEYIFTKEKPSALILVSVLGLSPEMDKIISLCEKHNVILLEDNCESQGTKFDKIKLGNFGLMSSFSTFFGHTMSTIEGGIISTNDEKIYNLLVQLRSHGWDRDLNTEKQKELREKWEVDDFTCLYTFYEPGFNLRSTDLQAFLGINQLKKVDEMINKRNQNFIHYKKRLDGQIWFPKETDKSFTSCFAIPVICENSEEREKLIKKLEENSISCRPIISGSMGTQPFYTSIYGYNKLPNCDIVDTCGIYVPNHNKMTEDDVDKICNILLRND